jgi:hypothetical protein
VVLDCATCLSNFNCVHLCDARASRGRGCKAVEAQGRIVAAMWERACVGVREHSAGMSPDNARLLLPLHAGSSAYLKRCKSLGHVAPNFIPENKLRLVAEHRN